MSMAPWIRAWDFLNHGHVEWEVRSSNLYSKSLLLLLVVVVTVVLVVVVVLL